MTNHQPRDNAIIIADGVGCEDGFFNMHDDDPLWYDEDDTEMCDICEGRGGYWVCPNAEHHPKESEATHD